MQTQKLDIGGGVVMWNVDDSDRQKLEDGLEALGLSDLMPRPRTPKAILHEALKARYANSKVLVRPLDKRSAFTVVREDRGEATNEYINEIGAEVDDDGKITLTPYNSTDQWMIETAYENAAGVIPGINVTRLLVGALNGLYGIALKPSGGVYWLPEKRLARWSQIVKVIEDAAKESGKNNVFLLRSVADADAMRTVRAGIINDISRALEEITKDLEEGGLGELGLQSRVDRAKALHRKLKEYEGVLGESLSDVREKIDLAADAAASAIMIAAASAVPVTTI